MIFRIFTIILISFQIIAAVELYQTEILHEWTFVNFTFQTELEYQQYVQNKQYENWYKSSNLFTDMRSLIAGVKVSHTGDVFVSVPRWKNESGGVPATLSKVVTIDGKSLLQPYPSWEMNKIGDPNALQCVLGFEIDDKNVLWVVDQGKIGNDPAIPGSIKLLIFDLNTDTLIQSYYFSEEEAPLTNSFLNDIVVDAPHGFAYITDTGRGSVPLHAGLLVYNAAENTARRVLNQVNSTQPDPTVQFEINGEPVLKEAPIQAGADGIALSVDASTLFYCPLTGRDIYSIPTEILRDFSIPEEEIEQNVQWVLNKMTTSDGLAMSNEKNNSMYMTALELNGILKVHANFSSDIELITFHNEDMMWPGIHWICEVIRLDTIGFDHNGWLLFVSNQLHRFYQNELSWNETNFRIWRVFVDAGSYLDPVD